MFISHILRYNEFVNNIIKGKRGPFSNMKGTALVSNAWLPLNYIFRLDYI